MNADDNAFLSYPFGAVFLDDAPAPVVTEPVVYWDNTESGATAIDSACRPRLPMTRAGGVPHPQPGAGFEQPLSSAVARRLVA